MIDIGINITSAQFDKDAQAVLARAFEAGVTGIILTGTSYEASVRSGLVARSDKSRLTFTAGVHPHYASKWTKQSRASFESLWEDEQCVAVGECGLDYFRDLSPRSQQRAVFEAQLEAALAQGLPAFMHCRGAFEDFFSIATSFVAQGGRGIVHCFTGSTKEVLAYQELGLHIGVTGWVTEQGRGKELREAVRFIEPGKLHLETDAPYLTPRNHPKLKSGRHRNEPAYLEWVAQEVAMLRGEPLEELKQRSAANSRGMFNLSK